jgi:hypothetical protein
MSFPFMAPEDFNLYLEVSGSADRLLDCYLAESRSPDGNHDLAMHYITLSSQARDKAIQLLSEGIDD